ncbi:EF-hand domain-containing protein [Rhizorhabdus sp. FW153]|uniref:EF-hand domain-containing protein n=1 Tax=Rhizorhabdus sp. FW153 TaxID=3400216 RepID=UPI003CE6C4AE
MWRYLAVGAAGLMLAGGGLMLWRSDAAGPEIPPPAQTAAASDAPMSVPPAASEKTREEKRFGRYDKDKDGKISRNEYLASRQKAYAKLDANGDGRLSFEEWSAKTSERFAKADADRSNILTPEEFATTKVQRKSARPVPCIPEAES